MAELIFKLFLAVICILGISLNIASSKSISQALNIFSYFTIQSNLIVLCISVYGIILKTKRNNGGFIYLLLRSGAVLWILITGLVYHFMLSRVIHATGIWQISIIILHYITPLLAIINWILFEEKGKWKYIFSLYWLAYPVLYLVVSQVRRNIDGFSPYWFLNPVAKYPKGIGSYGNMAIAILILLISFTLLGLVIIKIDKVLKIRVS